MSGYKYHLVAVGGTFDRFHKGHESLLHTAFQNGERVVIGLTTKNMIQSKTLSPIIDSYELRRKAVEDFLADNKYENRYELVPLVDPYGPVKRRRDIEAVIVGPRFSKEAVDVLKKRIDIIHCPIVKTKTGPYLSSTAIRLGQVNRIGTVYQLPNHTLYLPEATRNFLKKPLGTLHKKLPANFKKPLLLVSAGDEATRTLVANGTVPNLSIVDLYVQRKKKYSSVLEIGLPEGQKTTIVRNPAGTLTPLLARSVRMAIRRILSSGNKETIQVAGEEDLAPLLCILFAPLTSLVCYGQPNEGIVLVEVTEKKKEEVSRLLGSFTPFPVSATIK
jgi:cytidyltransferase-like protein